MSTTSTPTSPSPTPTGASVHPLLHEDIFPLILDHCGDIVLARLMRVSRAMLADIIERRWPVITVDLTGFNRRPSRTSLPVEASEFSPAMTILLSRYAKMVRINPHRVAPCPPDVIWTGGESAVRTLIVQRKGLCQSHDPALPGWELPSCEICLLFKPTTLRIIGEIVSRYTGFRDLRIDYGGYPPLRDVPLSQYPILTVPSALSFAPTLTRLILSISMDNPRAEIRESYSDEYLHCALPAHIVDVVFVLVVSDYFAESRGENIVSNIGAHLAPRLVEGLRPGHAGRRWSVVGAEMPGRNWKPEVHDGVTVFLGSQQAMMAGMGRGLEKYGHGVEVMSRVRFVTLFDYLRCKEAKSDLTPEEISEFDRSEMARRQRLRQSGSGRG